MHCLKGHQASRGLNYEGLPKVFLFCFVTFILQQCDAGISEVL